MKINQLEIYVKKITGRGPYNFILLHNAGGNHHFFTHQIKLLKKYGNIILLDLPGHGTSQELRQYNMSDLSEVIMQLIEKMSLTHLSFIGLNNGANIAIDIALNRSLAIKNLILIDPPLFMGQTFIAEIDDFINQLNDEKNYKYFVDSLIDNLFINTSNDNKEIARHAFNTVNKKALQHMFKGLIEWDSQAFGKIKTIHCPTLCILTDEHHCSYNNLRQEAPQIEIGKLVGSRCWATLEVPGQVNAMIERFLQLQNSP